MTTESLTGDPPRTEWHQPVSTTVTERLALAVGLFLAAGSLGVMVLAGASLAFGMGSGFLVPVGIGFAAVALLWSVRLVLGSSGGVRLEPGGLVFGSPLWPVRIPSRAVELLHVASPDPGPGPGYNPKAGPPMLEIRAGGFSRRLALGDASLECAEAILAQAPNAILIRLDWTVERGSGVSVAEAERRLWWRALRVSFRFFLMGGMCALLALGGVASAVLSDDHLGAGGGVMFLVLAGVMGSSGMRSLRVAQRAQTLVDNNLRP